MPVHLRTSALVASIALVVGAVGCGRGDDSAAPVVRWYARDEAGGVFGAAIEDCDAAADGRYRIELVPLPNNADEQREQLVRRLAAQDGDIDLMNMDVVWTPEFANARWIRPWPEDRLDAATEGRLDIAVQAASFEDRVYGIPLNTNAQLLWYRTDLVDEAPATWDDMLAAADALEADGRPHVIWEQGQRYEGLVVWFASLLASAGGTILDEDGTSVTLEQEPTQRALEVLRDLSRSSHARPRSPPPRRTRGARAGRPATPRSWSTTGSSGPAPTSSPPTSPPTWGGPSSRRSTPRCPRRSSRVASPSASAPTATTRTSPSRPPPAWRTRRTRPATPRTPACCP